MKPIRLYTIAIAVALIFPAASFAEGPAAAAPASIVAAITKGPAKGALVIIGGGAMTPEIWQRFVNLAGGAQAKMVVIPTADEDSGIGSDKTVQKLESLGVKDVTALHTRDPKEADTDKFVAPLKAATGVWLGGGRQWRFADAYLNTRTQKELFAVLDRGGVIGGSSAGATIQGDFLVRGDTAGNELIEGDHTVGLGLLKNAAIDQHILRRNRQFDLIPLVEAHPDLLGIGIDESTAIVVEGDRFEVIGASYVAITDRRQWTAKGRSSPNDAAQKGKIYFLGRGDHFNLTTRRLVRADNKGAKKDDEN